MQIVSRNVKAYFLGKIRKIFQIVIFWNILSSILSSNTIFKYFVTNIEKLIGLMYSEPLLQWQHVFPMTLPLKWICCCTEYLMSRLICKKGLVSFLFTHKTYVFDIFRIASLRWLYQISKRCFFKLLNAMFLHNLWLIVTSSAKVSWQSNCHYNKFCHCIHYENMPIQIYWKFFPTKEWKFSDKNFWYFSYFCSKHRLWVPVRTASTRQF